MNFSSSSTENPLVFAPSSGRRPVNRIPHIILATILMVSIHIFWFIWLTPVGSGVPYVEGLGPRLIYAAVPVKGLERSLWSPVLLSLPTPAGFSGEGMAMATGVGPSFDTPLPRRVYLGREDYDAHSPSLLYRDDVFEDRRGWLDPTPLPRRSSPAGQSNVDGSRWVWWPSDGLERDVLAEIEIPGEIDQRYSFVGEVSVWVQFDDTGAATHVFLERNTDHVELNRDLVRMFYRWRVKPVFGGRVGRIHLRMVPEFLEGLGGNQ